MEWVIAALAAGCLFFALQIAMGYVRYKRAINPRIQRLQAASLELRARIEASKADLDEARSQLPPIKEEVHRLEHEYQELQRQMQDELAQQKATDRKCDRLS
jgi:TolA-binding protein